MTDVDILRRHFVAIATADYDDPRCPSLPVAAEVQAVRQWLCAEELGARRFDDDYPQLSLNPAKQQIRDALEDPPAALRWRESDAAVVFVTGHGVTAHDTHFLVLSSTDTRRLNATAIRSGDLVAWLSETGIEHLLLILDACYAGKAAGDVFRLDRDLPASWLVLPSATKNQTAVAGALTGAITTFLADLRSPRGARYGTGPYIDADAFLEDVQEILGDGQRLIPLGGPWKGEHPCLPNPHHRDDTATVADARHDLALPRDDLRTHWAPRARGVTRDEQPGWLFTGRAALMRELIDAATAAPETTLITGGAGSGKSAVLARLVTLSDPQFRQQYADTVADIPEALRPPSGAVDVAVVATGKLHTEVLAQICHALRVPAPTGVLEPTVRQRLDAWQAWLSTRQRPVTIVVDALDEADNPRALIRDVLAHLEENPHTPTVRLLLGVRSLAAGDAREAAPETAALIDLATETLRARRIAVDEPPWWDQHDVVAYTHSILRHAPGSPYRTAPATTTAAVADALGRRAGRSFLIARIAASSLAERDTVTAADDPGWLTALDNGILGVFRQDLHQSLPEPDDRRRAVVLLRAVAFARGAGLPWRHIWPRVARAVDDDSRDYGDADIAWLLTSRLGAYLVTDREDNTTVYRLFHDLLRSTLQHRWRELLEEPPA